MFGQTRRSLAARLDAQSVQRIFPGVHPAELASSRIGQRLQAQRAPRCFPVLS